jgi:hypothetical protein
MNSWDLSSCMKVPNMMFDTAAASFFISRDFSRATG